MKKAEPALFGVHIDRPGGNGHKLKHRRFRVNLWKEFFTVSVTQKSLEVLEVNKLTIGQQYALV